MAKRGPFKDHRSHIKGSRAKGKPFGNFCKIGRKELAEWERRFYADIEKPTKRSKLL
jgi:hypothetical protein